MTARRALSARVKRTPALPTRVILAKGEAFIARGPLRIEVATGRISSRGIEFSPRTPPLIVKAWEAFDLTPLQSSEVRSTGIGRIESTGQAYPSEWAPVIDRIRQADAKTIMVTGESDTGKSTFVTLIANALLAAHAQVFVVDGDIGQSSIGPPTTIGLGAATRPLLRLTGFKLLDAYFAGDTSPAYCLEEVIQGTGILSRRASDPGGPVVVDTCGLATGPLGQHLTAKTVDAVGPDMVVVLERDQDLDYLERTGHRIVRVPGLVTARKNLEARRAFRLSQYLACLEQSRVVPYNIASTSFEGYRARRWRDRPKDTMSIMESEHLEATDLVRMERTIVGLHKGPRYVDLGIIESVEPKDDLVRILTPAKEDVDTVIVGNLRLVPGGETRHFQGEDFSA